MFELLSDWLVYSVFGLAQSTREAEIFHFFIYDLLKIYLLMLIVVLVISFIRSYLPPHRIRKLMMRQRFGTGNILAALLGAVTPFCSCSSIPLFIGFLEAEIPLGIAFSYIITSPLVNEIAFVIMGGMFGWRIAVIYALSGIVLGVLAGLLIGRMKLEKEVLLKFEGEAEGSLKLADLPKTLEGKLRFSVQKSWEIFRKLWLIIAIGVGIGALIHGLIPAEFFQQYLSGHSVLAVPLAVIVGVPIYANASTIVPIAFALSTKGIQLGTILAFMMAVVGLSLPEAIMLKKVISLKLLAIFFGLVAFGITVIGLLFNFLT
ncbi:permease [Candidatus Peregrinibacteria bacterium]|nr:permease [Candidatus Peregrinibacteria bacterium]